MIRFFSSVELKQKNIEYWEKRMEKYEKLNGLINKAQEKNSTWLL